MTDPTPFNRLLGERVRRLVEKDGRSMEAISFAAGMGPHTVSRIVRGHVVKVETLLAILHEVEATGEDLSAIYADFVEHRKERADG
ncbi:helix-turn-helix transcriptional regulator [Asaia bogorensis]|uniref:helix-turn-helix domain-containing protein n=1 Tax=Asaia bogorensis TaxID=91915 RepID=UPI000EFD91E8|nr:helix-turn-helix transcriptional regulator [Asaia bogorensis]